MEQQGYEQRGYLNEPFRLFHLKNAMEERLDWHYHTFHKIIVLLGGRLSYGIEGRSYPLQKGDLVLVPQGCIHRPEVEPGAPYERMVLYISPDFLQQNSIEFCKLEQCFFDAREQFRFVLRGGSMQKICISRFEQMEREMTEANYGWERLCSVLLQEVLIYLTRGCREHSLQYAEPVVSDEKVAAILQYISEHLTEPLSIVLLAEQFYISKYHMMRRFREETGYTIHSYLTSKRLLLARQLISGGTPILQACEQSGFGDYSAFSRAYRKQFGQIPRKAGQMQT